MSEPALFGLNLFGDPVLAPSSGPVAERFIVPPFSVLDAKSGDWQDRKAAWVSMGLETECAARRTDGKNAIGSYRHREKEQAESTQKMMAAGDGVLFDPVLCELAYRWWCPDAGQVVDPFAGGSVRGVVASALGRRYWGCDLRREQIDANERQASDLCADPRPVYVCGDSLLTLADAPLADFVFSCPPYGDLEQYSDDPADLSAMPFSAFLVAYQAVIAAAVGRLKQDRFACFVVGDYRGPDGLYRNLPTLTIGAFTKAGAKLYNEAVLATSVGSASMRVTRQFCGGRKLCKTHQNVLVFVKGDWRKAVDALGEL